MANPNTNTQPRTGTPPFNLLRQDAQARDDGIVNQITHIDSTLNNPATPYFNIPSLQAQKAKLAEEPPALVELHVVRPDGTVDPQGHLTPFAGVFKAVDLNSMERQAQEPWRRQRAITEYAGYLLEHAIESDPSIDPTNLAPWSTVKPAGLDESPVVFRNGVSGDYEIPGSVARLLIMDGMPDADAATVASLALHLREEAAIELEQLRAQQEAQARIEKGDPSLTFATPLEAEGYAVSEAYLREAYATIPTTNSYGKQKPPAKQYVVSAKMNRPFQERYPSGTPKIIPHPHASRATEVLRWFNPHFTRDVSTSPAEVVAGSLKKHKRAGAAILHLLRSDGAVNSSARSAERAMRLADDEDVGLGMRILERRRKSAVSKSEDALDRAAKLRSAPDTLKNRKAHKKAIKPASKAGKKARELEARRDRRRTRLLTKAERKAEQKARIAERHNLWFDLKDESLGSTHTQRRQTYKVKRQDRFFERESRRQTRESDSANITTSRSQAQRRRRQTRATFR